MPSSLTAKVEFSKQAIVTACGHHFDWRMGKTWRNTQITGWSLILLGIFSLRFEILLISAMLIAAGLSALALRKFYLHRCLKSGLKSPFFGETHQWQFTPTGIKIKAPGKMSKLAWSQLTDFYAPTDGLLLYTSPATFFWLPKDGFASGDEFHQTLDLIRHQASPTS
jgi:hypothetical protein